MLLLYTALKCLWVVHITGQNNALLKQHQTVCERHWHLIYNMLSRMTFKLDPHQSLTDWHINRQCTFWISLRSNQLNFFYQFQFSELTYLINSTVMLAKTVVCVCMCVCARTRTSMCNSLHTWIGVKCIMLYPVSLATLSFPSHAEKGPRHFDRYVTHWTQSSLSLIHI